MRDVLPAEQARVEAVRALLMANLAAFGYMPLDLPTIESRQLYQRKLGDDLVGKVYEFSFGGRDLALRPEWTASLLRAYVGGMQDQPLPLRLSYCGPVFRYERPQRHTYRQFTQLGVELIGGPAPRADAEILSLACTGLNQVGVTEYRVVLGHIGVARALLGSLALSDRTRSRLIWGMERLRAEGIETLRERLGTPAHLPSAGLSLPPGLDDAQAAGWLLNVLEAMQIDLSTGTRSPEAMVQRLLRSLRRGDEGPEIERALDLLARLCTIHGAPAETLPQAAALFAEAGLRPAALDEVRAILDLLPAHGIRPDQIAIDFGLGRGLHYYTGIIFEIYDRDDMQLCGGGRYDDLVVALGGNQPVPAVGCAYGLERVVAAAKPPPADTPRAVLVAAVAESDYPYAVELARRLRSRHFTATVDVRGRSVGANLRDAARRGFGFVAIVGGEEREQGRFVWRDLNRRDERRLNLDEVETL
ncbi:MAG: ATP phosphoribosyltransferase regulatory subunit [Oscillochloris sp.]|nr:ATP phosphoribosyltransferase regulatory subunit [Oscillochloris sp.]